MSKKPLASFNPVEAELLGEGGEAQVYALDMAHVIRLFREGASAQAVAERTNLMAEIASGAKHLPFETPEVVEQGVLFGRIFTVEKRIPGTSLLTALATAQESIRRSLIEQYLQTAWQLGDIQIRQPFFGEFGRADAVQTNTWAAYLAERARRSLAASPFAAIDVEALTSALATLDDAPAFVHLDYFAGNVMVDGARLTAVIDFGYSSIVGDRRMNAVAAAAYLMTPHITPTAVKADHAIAMTWLQERELLTYFEPGSRWLAAYWAFAHDDVALYAWCKSILD